MPTMIITGDKALNRKLKKLAGPAAKKVVTKAARIAMKNVAFAAKMNAPEGESGQLKRSIKVKAMKRSRTRFGVVVRSEFDGFYGSFTELGTKKQAAQGWMKQAAESNQEQTLAIYRRELRNGLLAIARHG